MFTGLVEEMGRVDQAIRTGGGQRLTVAAKRILDGLRVGDSIAVSGVCLTVTEHSSEYFRADVVPETMTRSTFGELRPGDRVNLERAMPADGRFGGHMVAGHVDAVGSVIDAKRDGFATLLSVSVPEGIARYIVDKGSIAVDGVSLTVMTVERSVFTVSIIPHTEGNTTLAFLRQRSRVNIEVDVLGKYVERLLSSYGHAEQRTSLRREPEQTVKRLRELGYS